MTINSHVLFGWDNGLDGATLAGGAWTTGLPLDSVMTRQLDDRARSMTAHELCTWFHVVTTEAVTCALGLLAGHNLTSDAQWRLRAFTTNPRPLVDGIFTVDAIPAGWTLSRGTIGTYFDADGVLRTAAADTWRPHHDTAGAHRGILLEAAATNNFTRARDLTHSDWTKTSVTVTRTVTGLDGVANTACRITATAGNGRITMATAIGTGQRVASYWMRRVSGTGAVEITVDNEVTWTAIGPLTSAWQRVYVQQSGEANSRAGFRLATNGDVIEVDCAQYELGDKPTSFIDTTTAAVTRAADNFSTTSLGGFAGGTGTLVVRGTMWRGLGVGASLRTNSSNYIALNFGATASAVVVNGGVTQGNITGQAMTDGVITTGAVAFGTNDVRSAWGGTLGTPDIVATIPAVTTLQLGAISGTASEAVSIERVTLYATDYANADLQSLSSADMEIAAAFDTGWLDAWPAEYLATANSDRNDGRTGAAYPLTTPHSATYWRFDASDAGNPEPVEIGRAALMAHVWQPSINANVGIGIGHDDRAQVTEASSGAEYFDELPNPIVQQFGLPALSDDEAWQAFELQAATGATGEIWFSRNPLDRKNLPRHSYLARCRRLSALEAIGGGYQGQAYEMKQLL